MNNLGIPGLDFLPGEERHYPMGRVAAHVLGGVDIDEHGVAGVEKWFNKRLMAAIPRRCACRSMCAFRPWCAMSLTRR